MVTQVRVEGQDGIYEVITDKPAVFLPKGAQQIVSVLVFPHGQPTLSQAVVTVKRPFKVWVEDMASTSFVNVGVA